MNVETILSSTTKKSNEMNNEELNNLKYIMNEKYKKIAPQQVQLAIDRSLYNDTYESSSTSDVLPSKNHQLVVNLNMESLLMISSLLLQIQDTFYYPDYCYYKSLYYKPSPLVLPFDLKANIQLDKISIHLLECSHLFPPSFPTYFKIYSERISLC